MKLWEVDADVVIRCPDPQALPLVALLKATRKQLGEVDRRIEAVEEGELRDRLRITFETFLGLRYDKEEVERIRQDMWSDLEILKASSVTGPLLRKAVAEGRRRGLEKGQQAEALRLLKRSLALRFPGLENAPELDRVRSLEAIEKLFDLSSTSKRRASVQAAIRSAAASNRASPSTSR